MTTILFKLFSLAYRYMLINNNKSIINLKLTTPSFFQNQLPFVQESGIQSDKANLQEIKIDSHEMKFDAEEFDVCESSWSVNDPSFSSPSVTPTSSPSQVPSSSKPQSSRDTHTHQVRPIKRLKPNIDKSLYKAALGRMPSIRNEDDRFKAYGHAWGVDLRDIHDDNPIAALHAKRLIDEVIYKARLNDLSVNSKVTDT